MSKAGDSGPRLGGSVAWVFPFLDSGYSILQVSPKHKYLSAVVPEQNFYSCLFLELCSGAS